MACEQAFDGPQQEGRRSSAWPRSATVRCLRNLTPQPVVPPGPGTPRPIVFTSAERRAAHSGAAIDGPPVGRSGRGSWPGGARRAGVGGHRDERLRLALRDRLAPASRVRNREQPEHRRRESLHCAQGASGSPRLGNRGQVFRLSDLFTPPGRFVRRCLDHSASGCRDSPEMRRPRERSR
jgi:hypothetical protein